MYTTRFQYGLPPAPPIFNVANACLVKNCANFCPENARTEWFKKDNIEMGGGGGHTKKTDARNAFFYSVANFRPAPVVFFMCVRCFKSFGTGQKSAIIVKYKIKHVFSFVFEISRNNDTAQTHG